MFYSGFMGRVILPSNYVESKNPLNYRKSGANVELKRSMNQAWDKHLRAWPFSTEKEKEYGGSLFQRIDLRLVPK